MTERRFEELTVHDQAYWDEKYRSVSGTWGGDANANLIREASDLTPGAALDAGTGEGMDALWLARRGWQVTAIDISTVALERNAAEAQREGPEVAARIRWQPADITVWTPPQSSYDLVSAQFMHLPPDARASVFRRLAGAVASGGTLLIVGHHPSDLQTAVRRPKHPDLLFTPADVEALLEPHAWTIAVSDVRPRNAADPDGNDVRIHDTVVRAQRR